MTMRLTIVILVFASLARAQEAAPDPAKRVEGLIAELKAAGWAVPGDAPRVEQREVEACLDDVETLQALVPEAHFVGVRHLLRAWIGEDPGEPGALKRLAARGRLAKLAAYYQPAFTGPGGGRIVLVRSALAKEAAALGEQELTLAHELMHTWQDRTRGLRAMHRGAITTEAYDVRSCLVEGEAEVGALAVALARRKQSLAEVDPRELELADALMDALVGEAARMHLVHGRRLVLAALKQGGREAVDALFEEPPATAEQVLHPAKRGQDAPTLLPPFAWPDAAPRRLAVACDDTLGELRLAGLLAAGDPSRADEAFVAATGWDGDRLRVFSDAEGRWALAWRTAWDRPVDAEQFEAAWRARAKNPLSRVRRAGRVVEVLGGSTLDLVEALLAIPAPVVAEADPRDATTTEAAERDRPRRAPAVREEDGERVGFADAGVSLLLPRGWQQANRGRVKVFMAPAADDGDGFRDNLTVVFQPDPIGDDLAAHERANREQIAAIGGKLLAMERVERDGRAWLRYELTMVPPGQPGAQEIQCVGVLFPLDGRIVVITGTFLPARAGRVRASMNAILDSMKFDTSR